MTGVGGQSPARSRQPLHDLHKNINKMSPLLQNDWFSLSQIHSVQLRNSVLISAILTGLGLEMSVDSTCDSVWYYTFFIYKLWCNSVWIIPCCSEWSLINLWPQILIWIWIDSVIVPSHHFCFIKCTIMYPYYINIILYKLRVTTFILVDSCSFNGHLVLALTELWTKSY